MMHMQWWKYVNSIEYCYYLYLIYECEILLVIKWTKQLSDKIKEKKNNNKTYQPNLSSNICSDKLKFNCLWKNKRNFSCWWVTIRTSKYRFILFVCFEWNVFVKYLDHSILFFHFELINIDKTLFFVVNIEWKTKQAKTVEPIFSI